MQTRPLPSLIDVRVMEARDIAIRILRKIALSQARILEVVADSGEDGVGGIAGPPFGVVAAEVSFGRHGAISGSMAERRRLYHR
jgi:hypothetical protein